MGSAGESLGVRSSVIGRGENNAPESSPPQAKWQGPLELGDKDGWRLYSHPRTSVARR